MAHQFESVSSKYGAPMGRRADGYIETQDPRFVRLFRVRLDSGGYDDGGAYWGIGEPLYCAIDDDGNRQFTRATHREKAALLLGIGNKALKIGLYRAGLDYGLALLDGRAPMPAGQTRESVSEWMRSSGQYFDGAPPK
jgi:hypothetical protein